MKVVLFGAGASYGSGQVEPRVPPLGNELFEVLCRLYPISWGQIPEKFKTLFNNNFEEGMAEVIDKGYATVGNLMQSMGIFFSYFHLTEDCDNLYIDFLEQLKSKGICEDVLISTINYECLIEKAANLVGLRISYFNSSNNNELSLWKIHGSCNFKLIGIEATRGVIINSQHVSFDGNIQALNPGDVKKEFEGNTAFHPSMCLFAKDKPITIAPSIISGKQEEWSTIAEEAEVICIIGVRPNTEDSHIWDAISECKGKFLFIGNLDDYNSYTSTYRMSKDNLYLGNRWNEAFDEAINQLV